MSPDTNGTSNAEPLISVDGLTVRYGGVVAVSNVSFDVPEGSIVGLIGPNGAGKTTIVDALTGYTRPAEGVVRFAGADITGKRAHRLAQAGMTRTFQSVELFDDLTVEENLLAASDRRGVLNAMRRLVTPAEKGEREAVTWALEVTGLSDVADRLPSELSYGKAKLAGLARALACKPRLLLLDEPAAGLDSDETQEVARQLRELPSHGVSLLLIDHDMSLVMGICDEIVVIDFGRMIAQGSPSEIRDSPEVISAYLGSQHAIAKGSK